MNIARVLRDREAEGPLWRSAHRVRRLSLFTETEPPSCKTAAAASSEPKMADPTNGDTVRNGLREAKLKQQPIESSDSENGFDPPNGIKTFPSLHAPGRTPTHTT